jgi:predicted dehydrogenase
MDKSIDSVRWGILGAAKIATTRVIPAIQLSGNGVVVALASRNAENARRMASQSGIPRAHGSYEALLADGDVEAVYIPLPNHMHVEWAKRAMEAGKHVLCEKPLGVGFPDASPLLSANPDRLLDEALMVRHHPQWLRVRALLRGGAIGKLRCVQGTFGYHIVDPENIRNKVEAAGGGLYDVGSYLVAMSRFVFECEPLRVMGTMDRDPNFGTDRLTSGILEFPEGQAVFTCGTQMKNTQNMLMVGTEGWIRLDAPFAVTPDHACRIEINRAVHRRKLPDHDVEMLQAADQYQLMVEDFSVRVRKGDRTRGGIASGLQNLRVLDAIRQSALTARGVDL